MIKVLILEDEKDAAMVLKGLIEHISADITVCAVIPSVHQAVSWFAQNDMPHLIFSDVQLSDGLSFEIFQQVLIPAPVIFVTGNEKYSLRAFEANGIDFLLKPVDEEKLRKSFARLLLLKDFFTKQSPSYNLRFNHNLAPLKKYKSSVLVYSGIRIIPVSIKDIYFVQSYNTSVYLNTLEKKYEIKETLNALIVELDPHDFYRANRQFIISRRSIMAFKQIEARKLQVILSLPSSVPIVISKERVSDFLKWTKG